MTSLIKETQRIHKRKTLVLKMGGDEAIERQHKSGKLTVRERIDLLFDRESFVEYGALATHQSKFEDMKKKVTPADGVITGIGQIHERSVAVVAYDFTVMGGSMGEVGERKVDRMREVALTERIPIIWLLDSAGARIQEVAGPQFSYTGGLFFDQVQLSGLVPQIAAIMGPTAAGTSYIPALADFVPMVEGTSSMALAGPHLVKTAINEDVSVEDLGGSKIHCRKSGVGDLEVKDDRECIKVIREYLSYFPSHSGEKPSRIESQSGYDLSMSEKVLSLLPEDPRKGYDIKKLLVEIVDKKSDESNEPHLLELKPDFAKNIITALGRINGESVGILANQPKFMGGVLDLDASDKAARFLQLCDAFNIPVVFLHDCPGFMVGSRMESLGIIRHGAKMLFAVSEMTVPKLSVIVRRSYGAGYYVMCGKGMRPDMIVGWPSSEIGLMSPEGAVNIAYRKEIQQSKNPEETLNQKVEQYRSLVGADKCAAGGYIDDIIDPRSTRMVLAHALMYTKNKKEPTIQKKHGVTPV